MFNVSVSVHMPNPDVAAAMESNVAVRIAIISLKFFIFSFQHTLYRCNKGVFRCSRAAISALV